MGVLYMVQLSPISWFLVINFLLTNLIFMNLNVFFCSKSLLQSYIYCLLNTNPLKW